MLIQECLGKVIWVVTAFHVNSFLLAPQVDPNFQANLRGGLHPLVGVFGIVGTHYPLSLGVPRRRTSIFCISQPYSFCGWLKVASEGQVRLEAAPFSVFLRSAIRPVHNSLLAKLVKVEMP